MPWQQVTLPIPKEQAEVLSDWLVLLGAISVTLLDRADQALLEPLPGEMPLWEQITLQALYPMTITLSEVIAYIQRELGPMHYEVVVIEDTDWQEAIKAATKPLCFGEKLWVIPSWLPHAVPSDAIKLILDPGLAFGTGEHPTTALCLTWLAQHSPLTGKLVIDYGCGSGILAIAALKCGAAQVWAVDYDLQALVATEYNAQQNSIAKPSLTTLLPEALPPLTVDIIMANILANPLCELAAHFAKLLKPAGQIVLSGILSEQEPQIRHAYTPWFETLSTTRQGDWLCLSGKRLPAL
jgi:ribosomal protein L11 methyltransferase